MVLHADDHTGYSSSSDLQQRLFGGDVAIDPAPHQLSAREPAFRREQIDRAHAKGDPVVMHRYREMLVVTARELGIFGAWDVTERFEKRFGKLDAVNRKAIGGIWQSAIHHGELVEVGTGKRPNGNKASVYRLVK